MPGAIEAGKAYLKYFLEDSELKKGLRGVGKQLQNVGKIGMAATAPLVGAFAAATAAFVSAGSELDDMSKRTGVSVRALSELKFAADQSGTSIATFEMAIRTMAKKGGGGEGTPEERFFRLAEEISKIEDPTKRAAAAMDAFGKSGTKLLPLFAEGKDGLAQLRQQASDLGLVMDAETAAAAENLGDQIDIMKSQVIAIGVQIGAAIAGPLTDFLKWLQGVTASTIAWIKEHPTLVKNVAAITAGILALSVATYAVGTALTLITLHPIVAFLALLAGALVVVVELYRQWADWSSKVAENLVNEVDVINATNPNATAGGGPVPTGIDAIAAKAAALQSTVQAGGGIGSVVDQATVDKLDQMFGEVLERAADAAEKSSEYLARIVQLIISGRGGGLLAGGD